MTTSSVDRALDALFAFEKRQYGEVKHHTSTAPVVRIRHGNIVHVYVPTGEVAHQRSLLGTVTRATQLFNQRKARAELDARKRARATSLDSRFTLHSHKGH